MLTAFAREADRLVPVEVAATADPAVAAQLLWIDIVDPQPADAAFAASLLGIAIPSLQEMEEIELSARLYEEDDAVFMTAPLVVRPDGDAPRLTPLTFILGRRCLVTVRHAEVAPFDEVRGRRLRANGGTTAEVLMCDLLDAIINRIADVLERGASRCDTMSHEVFARKLAGGQELVARDLEAILQRIGRQGDMLGKLRESLVGLARLLSYHDARSPRDKREVRVRLKTMQRDVQALTDTAPSCRARSTPARRDAGSHQSGAEPDREDLGNYPARTSKFSRRPCGGRGPCLSPPAMPSEDREMGPCLRRGDELLFEWDKRRRSSRSRRWRFCRRR